MNDKDIKEYHDLDRLKTYQPLPSGLTVADSETPNCQRSQIRVKPGFDKWSLMTLEDIEEGCELTLKYKLYDPKT